MGEIGLVGSRKKRFVAQSNSEGKYKDMALATCEMLSICSLLQEMGFSCPLPMSPHYDNQATIHIASNQTFQTRTKHVEVDCHFVQEKVSLKQIVPEYV